MSPRHLGDRPGGGRLLRARIVGGACIAAVLLDCSMAAFGQVPAVLNGGPPVQVVPYVAEPGVPAFAVTPGIANPFAGADGSGGSGTGTSDPGTGTGTGSVSGGNGDSTGFVATSYNQYINQAVGSGQCVALVQAADPAVGLTATWTQGAPVVGDTNLAPGTVIATFNANGQYANATDGSSHAAIYLGPAANGGIQVLDQWSGSPAAVRTINATSTTGLAANTAGAFYVVSHAS